MNTYYGFDNLIIKDESSVMIGKFDGFHLGHKLLLNKLLQEKENGRKAVVFTFDFSPLSLKQNTSLKKLTTNEEKISILEKAGVNSLIICPFSKDIMELKPHDFLKLLFSHINVKSIICGDDFGFGYDRAGNIDYLRSVASEFDFELIVEHKLISKGNEISSTLIRNLLIEGNIEKANELLGYKYNISGTVAYGNQIGRTIGFPTANVLLDDTKLAPKYGVYASEILINNKIYRGISNIGIKPTISKNSNLVEQCSLEINIFDFNDYIYGQNVVVYLNRFIREEKKFSSVDDLKKQIELDVLSVKEI